MYQKSMREALQEARDYRDVSDIEEGKGFLEYDEWLKQVKGIKKGAYGVQAMPPCLLETGKHLAEPPVDEVEQVLSEHLDALHRFYGETMGVRIARKHVGWYLQSHDEDKQFRKRFNAIDDAMAQKDSIQQYFAGLRNGEVFAA